MNKSLFVLVVLVFCAGALHMQKYTPSKPGGTYMNNSNTPNGTSPSYPNYQYQSTPSYQNYQPTPSPQNTPSYPNYQPTPSTPNYQNYQPSPNYQNTNNYGSGTSGSSTTKTVYVNGKPYVYKEPFTLVCFNKDSNGNNIVYRYDSCSDAYSCANIMNDYSNCKGSVKKYPLGTRIYDNMP